MTTDPARLVIFDCDGTLVDSQHIIVACMTEAFEKNDLAPPPADAIKRIVGLSLMPSHSVDRVETVSQDYKDAFVARRLSNEVREPMFPSVVDTLDALAARKILLGVAIGKSKRGLDAVLAHHELTNRFITLQTADGHPSKPDPSMVETAMADAGAAPHATVMIGDKTFDVEMGRAAGAHAIGVSWGYHPVWELHQAGAHIVADAFPNLTGHINAMLASVAR